MDCIVVSNLGKKYKRYPNRLNRLAEWLSGGKLRMHQSNWVLREVSFTVKAGESVGIIGLNGAGKSTLLKILTGTTQPSEGSFTVAGRVAALLELGIGFHPDFTGRQNVLMAGQLTGVGSNEIAELIPAIESFAEIGDYIDQPLRTYSSGMVVRLAFATATAVRPDIFIVDEALSVGDAYFQHKCFDRIRQFKEQGTTLLFVSHDPGAVKNLCDRGILLDHGVLIKEGNPEEVFDYYNAVIAKREADYSIKQSRGEDQKVMTRSGDGSANICRVMFYAGNQLVNAVQVGDIVEVLIGLEVFREIYNPTVGIMFKDRLGNEIFGTNTYYLGLNLGTYAPGKEYQVVFRMPINFGVGHYSLSVAVHEGYAHLQGNYDWWDHADTLQVIAGEEMTFVGVCYIPVRCQATMIAKNNLSV
jgi:lipopolysaccharide transport system ATP-binding protein